jgi:hypothetical protein
MSQRRHTNNGRPLEARPPIFRASSQAEGEAVVQNATTVDDDKGRRKDDRLFNTSFFTAVALW